MWTSIRDSEDPHKVAVAERNMQKRLAEIDKARRVALAQTNYVIKTFYPGDQTAKKVRTSSKMKVVAALMEAGLWEQTKAWIEQAGLYDLYLAAQDFREDNEYFTQGLATIKAQLNLTDAQVNSILSKCLAD